MIWENNILLIYYRNPALSSFICKKRARARNRMRASETRLAEKKKPCPSSRILFGGTEGSGTVHGCYGTEKTSGLFLLWFRGGFLRRSGSGFRHRLRFRLLRGSRSRFRRRLRFRLLRGNRLLFRFLLRGRSDALLCGFDRFQRGRSVFGEMLQKRIAGIEQSQETIPRHGNRYTEEDLLFMMSVFTGDKMIKIKKSQTAGHINVGKAVDENFFHVLFLLQIHS